MITPLLRASHAFLLSLTAAIALPAAEFEIANETEAKSILPPGAAIAKLATGMRFIEGPVWIPKDGGYLIFSDIPANQLKRWTSKDGVATFRDPSHNANGNTLDLEGRLLTAEHSGRRVARMEPDGTLTTVVDRHDGRKLNSPNDVVVKSDGTLWFTDPDYGLGRNPREQEGNFVYRLDPASGNLSVLVRDFDKPNGLCFSPDESKLYIADSGQPKHLRAFKVTPDGRLEDGRVFCVISKGVPDGIRCDARGRIWSSTGHGAQVFGPDGALILTIHLPESAANLCFGGPNGTTVFFTARTSLYSVETLVQGAGRPR